MALALDRSRSRHRWTYKKAGFGIAKRRRHGHDLGIERVVFGRVKQRHRLLVGRVRVVVRLVRLLVVVVVLLLVVLVDVLVDLVVRDLLVVRMGVVVVLCLLLLLVVFVAIIRQVCVVRDVGVVMMVVMVVVVMRHRVVRHAIGSEVGGTDLHRLVSGARCESDMSASREMCA